MRVKVASSSKNSVANASHQRLSLSCNIMDGCKDVIFSTSGRAIAGRPLSMRKVVARTRDASITSLLPSASGIANQSIYNVTRVRHSRLTRRYLGQLPPPRLASNSLVYNFFRHDRDRVTKAPCFRGVVCTCLPSTSPKLHSPFPPLLCNPRQHFQSVFSPRERQGKLTQGRERERERKGRNIPCTHGSRCSS